MLMLKDTVVQDIFQFLDSCECELAQWVANPLCVHALVSANHSLFLHPCLFRCPLLSSYSFSSSPSHPLTQSMGETFLPLSKKARWSSKRRRQLARTQLPTKLGC